VSPVDLPVGTDVAILQYTITRQRKARIRALKIKK